MIRARPWLSVLVPSPCLRHRSSSPPAYASFAGPQASRGSPPPPWGCWDYGCSGYMSSSYMDSTFEWRSTCLYLLSHHPSGSPKYLILKLHAPCEPRSSLLPISLLPCSFLLQKKKKKTSRISISAMHLSGFCLFLKTFVVTIV